MLKLKESLRKYSGRLLTCLVFALAPLAAHAATNTIIFYDQVLSSGNGPVAPVTFPGSANTVISGSSLNAGDTIVLDGIVANTNKTTGDSWLGIEFNAGGFYGLTGATLGVEVKTGSGFGQAAVFTNAVQGASLAGTNEMYTNRFHVEIYCATTGSTTNMGWSVSLDEGLTGAYTSITNGTNITFAGNSIVLNFGAYQATEFITQYSPVLVAAAASPTNSTVITNKTVALTSAIAGGYTNNVTVARHVSYHWLKNGVAITNATNSSYTTPALGAGDNGDQFAFIVTNLNNTANALTSSVATVTVRSVPGVVTINFQDTSLNVGGGAVTTPGVSVSGSSLLAGDSLVYDGYVILTGTPAGDAWGTINLNGAGYGNVESATLGMLARLVGGGACQLFINGVNTVNPAASGTPTNRVRIVLYPSANGSTTNMGYSVQLDQNIIGQFLPAATGTNLTFANNTITLTWGDENSPVLMTQNYSNVSVYYNPTPANQTVAVGSSAQFSFLEKGWSPAISWLKNGSVITNATNRFYTTPVQSLANNGDQYVAVVSNLFSPGTVVTSAVATITMRTPNNLEWWPVVDGTSWNTTTANWTTNGGSTFTTFTNGDNVTIDDAGGLATGGIYLLVTNGVTANTVTVNDPDAFFFLLYGPGNLTGQNLVITGGAGGLGLNSLASFNTATLNSGTVLQVGFGGTNGSFQANTVTNNGVIDFNNTSGNLILSGPITGSGQIDQLGAGATLLTSPNSVLTIGSISAGVLQLASAPLGPIENDAELEYNSPNNLLLTNSMSGGGFYAFTGLQTSILTGVSTHTGVNLIFWGPVIVNNSNALGDATIGSTTVEGADSAGGLYLSNSTTWTQPLTLDTRLPAPFNSGTAADLGSYGGTNAVSGTLTFANGGSELNLEATTGTLAINSTPADSLTGVNNLNLQGAGAGILNGALADNAPTTVLNLLMRGSGSWTLSANNTYSGTTTVTNGVLFVNGQIGSNAVSVSSAGTLGGTGVIGGAVSAGSGGTIAPGTNGIIGTLTISNSLTLASGSTTSIDINKTTGARDQIVGLTTVAYGGTLVVSNLSGTLTTNDSFKIFTATSYGGLFAGVTPATPAAGLSWNTNTLATDGTLRITTGGGPPTTPTNITFIVTNGNFQLGWPSGYIGWILQAQTDSMSVGISTNWFNVPGSSNTNIVSVPINNNTNSVFFRLFLP